jgi:argininosuccinate lyase
LVSKSAIGGVQIRDRELMRFNPDYVRLVLRENFEDAKRLFLEPLLAIHRAHLVMLAERGIVSVEDARRIRDALDRIDSETVRGATYDITCEDLFFYIDRLVAAACGRDVADRLHTARSRNDIDMTMYRMRLREFLISLMEATLGLRRLLVELARKHTTAIFPAHTHTQPAQPTTVAHYLLAVLEQLERDTVRLRAAYLVTNRSPLGACAITGTGFPIDRDRTSELLGFDSPSGNTYGSIATVDYLLESAASAGVLLAGLGRFVHDMLLWCTREIGFLRLADDLVQKSSIMPQKRNPVALEHARALLSKALGQAGALPLAVHNTPFGDIVDTEDDLQPLVASAFGDAARAVALVAAAMTGAEFDVSHMRARAAADWVTATELADTLVREHDLAFGQAHAIVADVIRGRQADARTSLSDLLAAASRSAGRDIRIADAELTRILSPEHFISVRRTPGGPSPEVTGAALDVVVTRVKDDEQAVRALRGGLDQAQERLASAASQL